MQLRNILKLTNDINKEEKKIMKEKKKVEDEKKRKDNKIINDLVSNWQNTFGHLEHWNKELNGYTLDNIQVHDYGCSARIYAPWGIDLYDLENFKSIIQSGCKCEFIYDIPQHKKFAIAKFIYPENVKINEQEFYPISVKPWEFCPGFGIDGEPIKFNIAETPHILDAGQQRRGKNGAVDHAIVSWIHSCEPDEIMFYMFQCAKNDLIKYKDVEHVYCYTDSMEDMLLALEHLLDEMNRRKELFEPMVAKAENNDNIYHYNLIHRLNPIPYIIVVIDEFIELMPDSHTDDKYTIILKNKIMKHIQRIGQWGGALGVNFCVLHQKPSAQLMPVFIKNQASIRICFGFEDITCCAIVLGDELAKYAHKLPPRKAYYSSNESNGYIYTSNLKGRIKMFIESSKKPNHRNLFMDLEKLSSKPKIKEPEAAEITDITSKDKGKAPLPIKIRKVENPIDYNIPQKSLDFNNVDPTKINLDQQKLIENIKKIPNFVPYDFTEPKVIIDKTKLDLSKSEKPKKKNKEED